jgi:carbamoylphosphate synthase large subunit
VKILFIGARLFDDVYFYLKEKGIYSILTESNENAPNLDLADEYHIVARGMEEPMKIAIEKNVDAVVPLIGIDPPLVDVAIMKEKLEKEYNIPVIFPNKIPVEICSNKFLTKEFFKIYNINTPNYFFFANNNNNQYNKFINDYQEFINDIETINVNNINNIKNNENIKNIKYIKNINNNEKIKSSDEIKINEESNFTTYLHNLVLNSLKINEYNKNEIPFDFPYVLKQGEGQGGKDLIIGEDEKSFLDYVNNFPTTLVEEYIDGYELSIEVLSYNDEYVPLVPVYKGDTSLKANHPLNKVRYAPAEIEGLDNQVVKEEAIKIAKALAVEGTIDIDFIFSKVDHKLYAIEINTRPSGTRYLSYASTSISPLLSLVDMIINNFSNKVVDDKIKNYYAIEVPVGDYDGPKLKEPIKKFSKNSWVVHGPKGYERVTVSGESKEKLNELTKNLNLERFISK